MIDTVAEQNRNSYLKVASYSLLSFQVTSYIMSISLYKIAKLNSCLYLFILLAYLYRL